MSKLDNMNDALDFTGANQQQREAYERNLLADREFEEDLKRLMSNRSGRRIMRKLFEVSGVHANPFTGNSQTFFNCGRLEVGRFFRDAVVAHCSDRYIQLLKEHKEDGARQRN